MASDAADARTVHDRRLSHFFFWVNGKFGCPKTDIERYLASDVPSLNRRSTTSVVTNAAGLNSVLMFALYLQIEVSHIYMDMEVCSTFCSTEYTDIIVVCFAVVLVSSKQYAAYMLLAAMEYDFSTIFVAHALIFHLAMMHGQPVSIVHR